MAISPQQLTIYLYSAHRAVIFAIAQLSCSKGDGREKEGRGLRKKREKGGEEM